jgi:hypothetical protein
MTPAQACGMLFLISQVLRDGDKKDAVKLVWTKKEIKEVIHIVSTSSGRNKCYGFSATWRFILEWPSFTGF